MIELLPKQLQLISSEADVILFGGARGGAKTFGSTAAIALEAPEIYTESEMRMKGLDRRKFRVKRDEATNQNIYFRYLIDYPYYMGVIVRRSLPQLRVNSLVECKKIYPLFGGRFEKQEFKWTFPSGAQIYLRPLNDDATLDFFQGTSFHRFVVEELTQFSKEMIEKAATSCRSAAPIGGGYHIKPKIIFTSNPGGKGHKWVKERFVDKCPPVPDGDPVYIDEFDIAYQPLKANKLYVNEFGETFLFIPSLVFDNPHLAEIDKRYIRQLLGLNKSLKAMWLYGRWDVRAGQFFDMWQDELHVIDECDFYKVDNSFDLMEARRKFDWRGNGYRLFASNDYGFGKDSAWAFGAYAVDNEMKVVKFTEIVESGLSIRQQAQMTKEHLLKYYNMTVDDFELIIADPKSYWESRDRGEEFYTFADEYEKEGIWLTKGKNARISGAAAMIEMLRLQDNGLPSMRYLSNCEWSINSIPHLPSDPNNPNDVDTLSYDHCYDVDRYFVSVVIGEPFEKKLDKENVGWRSRLKENVGHKDSDGEVNMTRNFLTA